MSASLLKAWLQDSSAAFLWVDFEAYAARVFANAGDDWYSDPARYAGTLIQATGVIPTRCLNVDMLAPFVAGLDQDEPSAARLCETLGDARSTRFIEDALNALLHRFSGKLDVILKIRTPWDLLAGGDRAGGCEFDELDDVASAIAALVRQFADKPIAGLMLTRATGGALSADEIDAYEPLLGAARHYDWCTALAFDAVSDGKVDTGGLDVDAVLLPSSPLATLPADATPRLGGGLDAGFWAGTAAPVDIGGRLLYGTIPAAATPETVLSVLRALR